MLQATAASLLAGSRLEEQGHLLPRRDGIIGGSMERRSGYNLAIRLRNRICSDSCLKFVYLSCATLISASFIIECILLHLIVVPYLSESVFEPGVCKFSGSRREENPKKCENKCSKERSSFPCLQLRVVFTPFRMNSTNQSVVSVLRNQSVALQNGGYVSSVTLNNDVTNEEPIRYEDINMAATAENLIRSNQQARLMIPWGVQQKFDIDPGAKYNFSSPESRTVYLYDYFSTFASHKGGRCATSPCHRREEDNKDAVEDFKRLLWRRHIFLCYARPNKASRFAREKAEAVEKLEIDQTESALPNERVAKLLDQSISSDNDNHTTHESLVPLDGVSLRPIVGVHDGIPIDPKNAAAILFKQYTPKMFLHSLFWPGGIFLGALIILLFTYLIDGCQAWARDKTVIA